MSKRIEYRCDLCDRLLRKGLPSADDAPFVSFEFNRTDLECPPQYIFRTREPASVERHICHRCLAGLVAMAERELPDVIE